jgi:hypothetical protein
LDGVANKLGYKLKIKHYAIILIIVTVILGSILKSYMGKGDTFTAFLISFGMSLIICISMMGIFQKRLDKFISKYKTEHPEEVDIISIKKEEYLMDILNLIKNNYLPNFRILHISKYEKLFYGNEGCALVNAETGRIIIYGKDNIKNVLLEHKHLGSSSFGSSYSDGEIDGGGELIYHVHPNISIAGGSHADTYQETTHESETIELYEWHLDILTDFIEYPKLSFIFDDDSKGVEEAKVIYGIFGK